MQSYSLFWQAMLRVSTGFRVNFLILSYMFRLCGSYATLSELKQIRRFMEWFCALCRLLQAERDREGERERDLKLAAIHAHRR